MKQTEPRAFPDQEGSGMTLRDYFAAAVIPSLVTKTFAEGFEVNEVAKAAFEMADAMLEERNK
jgi:hypothetical protein